MKGSIQLPWELTGCPVCVTGRRSAKAAGQPVLSSYLETQVLTVPSLSVRFRTGFKHWSGSAEAVFTV